MHFSSNHWASNHWGSQHWRSYVSLDFEIVLGLVGSSLIIETISFNNEFFLLSSYTGNIYDVLSVSSLIMDEIIGLSSYILIIKSDNCLIYDLIFKESAINNVYSFNSII